MNKVTTDIQLYKALRLKIGDEEATALVEFMDQKIQQNQESLLATLATKDDLKQVENKVSGFEMEIKKDMKEMELLLTEKINKVDADLTKKITDVELGLTGKITDVELGLTGKITQLEVYIKETTILLSRQIESKTTETTRWVFGLFSSIVALLIFNLFRK